MDFFKDSQNKVLVCIPTYNAEDSLSDTIKSILHQTFKQFDVLIIDNQSTDRTVEVAQQLKSDFNIENKIHIITNEENLGRIGNWNKCVEMFRQSPHSYLKFVFTGDTLEDNCLETLVNVFQKNPGIGLVASEYHVHTANKTEKKTSFNKSIRFTPNEALKAFIRKDNWVGAPIACMFSREAIKGIKFSDGIEWVADWKFYIDIARSFDSFYINEPLSNFYAFQRKYFLRHNTDPIARAEELFIKYYVLQKLEDLNSDIAKSLRKDLYRTEGKHLFLEISFLEIFWLVIYKTVKKIRNIFKLFGIWRYALMQKIYYYWLASLSNYSSKESNDYVVGSYDKHNDWDDYDTYLMKYVDNSFKNKLALDFGCGPGRSIIKYHSRFKRIDGVDISKKNIKNAKVNLDKSKITDSKLYVNNGMDIRVIPSDTYDFLMSTICMQHICAYSTRYLLLKEFFRVLKKGGRISIQMGYGEGAPGSVPYEADNFNAIVANGGCDTQVESSDKIRDDLESIGFSDFEYWIRPTGPGDVHQNWIFFTAKK